MKGFYFDEHMFRVVKNALGERGIYVEMAVDVGMEGKDDDTEHLPYAAEHDLVMVTFDHPFANRTRERDDHLGLICLAYSIRNDIGKTIEELALFHALYESERDFGQVFWLP